LKQVAIADFLDRKTAAIDALIAKKERLRELLQEKRQAVITQAVTNGLKPFLPTKDSGVEWLGRIPAHWAVIPLKRMSSRVVVGIAEAASHAYADSGVPIVRSLNVQPNHLVPNEVLFIEKWFAEKNASKTVREGDLLTQRTGEYSGATAVVPAALDGCQCFTLLITTPKAELRSWFASYFMNSAAGHEYFNRTRWGTAQPNISVPILQDLPLLVPPGAEQDEIVAFIRAGTRRDGAVEERIGDQIVALHEYRRAIITAAVTGQIDVTREAA
jgi:type I restriction enzyme, S subunit